MLFINNFCINSYRDLMACALTSLELTIMNAFFIITITQIQFYSPLMLSYAEIMHSWLRFFAYKRSPIVWPKSEFSKRIDRRIHWNIGVSQRWENWQWVWVAGVEHWEQRTQREWEQWESASLYCCMTVSLHTWPYHCQEIINYYKLWQKADIYLLKYMFCQIADAFKDRMRPTVSYRIY